MKRNEIILVSLLAFVNFTSILDFMIMMPLGNLLMPKWHLNTSQFAQIVSSYSIAAFASSFAAIFFADKFDRKKLLLFAYFFFLIGTFCCALAHNYSTMMAARIFTGLFGGLISSQVLSIIGDVVPYERRGRAMGLLMGGFALASIVGVPIGLKLGNTYEWYYPFLVVAIVGTILGPFLIKFIPKVNAHLATPVKLKERVQIFKNIFSNKAQITALIFSTVMVMGHFIIIPLINPFMVNNVGIPISQTPLIYLVGGISSFITASFVGKLADKYGKRKVFVIAALVSTIFIFTLTNMPQWNIVLVLSIFALWFSTATSRMVPAQAMTTQVVTAATRGGFMSFNSCLQNLGSGVATLTSGWITYNDANFKIHNYPILGYISIGLIFICIYFAYRLDKYIVAGA